MRMKKLKQNTFAQNVMRILGMKGVVFIFSMVSSILSARVLGPEGKGIYTVALAIAGMAVQFGNLGIHSANTYYLSQDRSILPKIVGNSIAVSAAASMISVVVLVICQFFLENSAVHGLTLILAFLCIPLQLYNMFQMNYFLALEKIKKYNMLELLSGVLPSIFMIFTALVSGWRVSADQALLLSLTASAVVLAVGISMLGGELKDRICLDRKLFLHMLPFGIKSYLSCLLSYLVLRADIFMIDLYLDKTQNGLYSLAVNLADIVNLAAVSVSMLLFPKLSEMKENSRKKEFIYKTLKVMSLLMLLLVSAAMAVSGAAVVLLYGDEYKDSVSVFRILMPGILFWALSSILFNYFSSLNKIEINIIASIVGLVVDIGMNYLLIERMGIRGVALASTISYIMVFFILYSHLNIGKGNEKQ